MYDFKKFVSVSCPIACRANFRAHGALISCFQFCTALKLLPIHKKSNKRNTQSINNEYTNHNPHFNFYFTVSRFYCDFTDFRFHFYNNRFLSQYISHNKKVYKKPKSSSYFPD